MKHRCRKNVKSVPNGYETMVTKGEKKTVANDYKRSLRPTSLARSYKPVARAIEVSHQLANMSFDEVLNLAVHVVQ